MLTIMHQEWRVRGRGADQGADNDTVRCDYQQGDYSFCSGYGLSLECVTWTVCVTGVGLGTLRGHIELNA